MPKKKQFEALTRVNHSDHGSYSFGPNRFEYDSVSRLRRPSPRDLETAFRRYPLAFRGVMVRANELIARGYEIVAESDDIREATVKKLKALDFNSKLHQITINTQVYGNGYLEIVIGENEEGNEDVIDLRVVNPVLIDFQRNQSNQIIFKNGQPNNYIQFLPNVARTEKNVIPIKKELLVHLIFHRLGDDLFGMSIFEPALKSIERSMNVESAIAQAIWRHGFPQLSIAVGDPEHEPNKQQIDDVGALVEDLNVRNEYIHPYWQKWSIMEAKTPKSFNTYPKTFIAQIVATLGVPEPILLGTGEGTNKATADVQSRHFGAEIKGMQWGIKNEVEKKLFTTLAELNNWSEVPTMEWNEILSADKTAVVGQAATLFEKRIVTRTEAREMIGFPPLSDFGDLKPDPVKPIPGQPNPGEEEKRGAGIIKDPSKIPEKEFIPAPATSTPSDKSRAAMVRLNGEFVYSLGEFFDTLRNTLLNRIISLHELDKHNKKKVSKLDLKKMEIVLTDSKKELRDILYLYSKRASMHGFDSIKESQKLSDLSSLSPEDLVFLDDYASVLAEKELAEVGSKSRWILVDSIAKNESFDKLRSRLTVLFNSFGSLTNESKKNRAKFIGLNELNRAYNNGILSAFGLSGAKDVSFKLSEKHCKDCASLKGASIGLIDAKGKLPLHPGCLCQYSLI